MTEGLGAVGVSGVGVDINRGGPTTSCLTLDNQPTEDRDACENTGAAELSPKLL